MCVPPALTNPRRCFILSTTMQISECVKGQCVTYLENGKPATVKDVFLDKREVLIELENGSRVRVQARLIEPAEAEARTEDDAEPSGPMRPCPNCAAKMSVDATTCPKCGFQYAVRKTGGAGGGIAKVVIVLIILAGAAYAVWKYVLHEKLPF